jgi:aryl-alcohol dehydrogenase-like predicted oxidoreductase
VRFRQLGSSPLEVPVVGLGASDFGRRCDLAATREAVSAALDAGMTLIDTADNYGQSEEFLGAALKGRRHAVLLASKFGRNWPGTARRAQIRVSVEESLRRLQTDYLDLYYLHRPDPGTPISETLSALDELVEEGKVRYIGSSNLAGWQIVEAEWTARSLRTSRFIVAQNEYNLLNRTTEAEVAPACLAYGVGIVAARPLAHGFLTGKYRRNEYPPPESRLAQRGIQKDAPDFDQLDQLELFARDRGVSLLQVAIGYLLAQPAVTSAVIGAIRPEQVRVNAAAGDWIPSEDDLATLNTLTVAPPDPTQHDVIQLPPRRPGT